MPEASKDDKYWKRRAKNNAAAKRSRDLRREKENSILQRVQFLEGQNQGRQVHGWQVVMDLGWVVSDLGCSITRFGRG